VEGNGVSVAILVGVWATFALDVFSTLNSSPQTTEINAASRAETLMKWVKLGLAQAALFVAMGMLLDKRRWPPLAGGGLAGVLLWVQYVHARSAGLKSVKPGTESTAPAAPGAAFTWGTRT